MKKSELNALKKMLENPEIRGKRHLKALIWMNETEPKCKIGDCYEVTDPGHRIYGVPVRRFHARIDKVEWHTGFGEFLLQYELTAHVKCGSKEKDFKLYALEGELCTKVKDNLNVLLGDEDQSESIDIHIPGLGR